ncbi:GmrSD restriction endonuclease domain-containing protein [Porphyromonas sp.]
MNPNYTLKELLDKYSVVIPQLQRDYAQGRDEAKELRERFLSQILGVLRSEEEERLNLDFVYGYDKALSPNHHPIFYPLDGQQRLTTLWLLHWYLLPSESLAEEREWLLRFSYHTRSSSTRFCQLLVEHAVVDGLRLDVAAIKDQPWYRQSYNADATIAAMLGTLRTIKGLVAPGERVALWERLCHQRALTFDVIDIKGEEFRLTDELYIKMNARGKQLTSFECYKADLTRALREIGEQDVPCCYKGKPLSYADYFAFKVDNEWLDLFYHGEIDGLDERMYGFIQNIAKLCFFLDPENAKKNVDAFTYWDSVNVFSRRDNAYRLISILDLFERIQAKQPLRDFFATLTPSIRFLEEGGKDASASVKDLFGESCDKNASVNLVLLLALSHYMEKYQLVEATEELQDYLRVVRNLLWEERQLDEMRYRSNVRINSLLTYWGWIEPLASWEQVLDAIKNSGEVFSKKLHQRVDFILKYPELKPLIGELEDHPLLAGQLGIFDLDQDANDFKRQAEAFKLIFDPAFCARGDADKLIIRALVASGYPGVQGKNVWGGYRDTWFFGGNGRWSTVLSFEEYEQDEQRKAIRQLLSQFAGGTGDTKEHTKEHTKERLQRIIDAYLESEDAKRRGWRYYFVKYPEFYSGDTNFFAWDNREEKADAYVDPLKSFSSNPLIGYHANAYVQVIWRLVGGRDTHCRPEWVQGAKDSRLHLLRSGIYIGHTPEGWRIDLPQGYVLPEEIMHAFELSPSNLILRETPTADRLERAVAFCKSLA